MMHGQQNVKKSYLEVSAYLSVWLAVYNLVDIIAPNLSLFSDIRYFHQPIF